jgi:hypothetical protein
MSRRKLGKLTPELAAKIADLVRKGLFPASICRIVGIDPHTLANWLKRGEREAEGIYHDLATAVAEAEKNIEGVLLQRIYAAAQAGDEKAAIFYLSRRFPQIWHEHPSLAPINDSADLSLADKARLIAQKMFAGDIPPEQAKTALAALREAAQVIDLDEVAAQVRRLVESESELTDIPTTITIPDAETTP